MYDVVCFLRDTAIDTGCDVPKEKSVYRKDACLYAWFPRFRMRKGVYVCACIPE